MVNSSQVLSYTTNNTNLNISQLQVQHDCCTCTVYWWKVSAIVNERNSGSVNSKESFSVPSGEHCITLIYLLHLLLFYITVPFIQNGSFHANITECIDTIIISVDYRVSVRLTDNFQNCFGIFFYFVYQVISCLHAVFFQNIVYFENAIQTVSSNNISSKLLPNHAYTVNSIITLSCLDVLNGTIIVNVGNRFGSQTTSFKITEGIYYRSICIAINNFGIVYILDVIDKYHTCDKDVVTVITTLIRSITVSSLVISTSGDHHFISTAFIHSGKQFYLVCAHQYNNLIMIFINSQQCSTPKTQYQYTSIHDLYSYWINPVCSWLSSWYVHYLYNCTSF